MQRAQAGALLQATNQAILQIRQAELNYYVSFYLTFSTQSAFIGGFVYSGLTQITFKMGARDPRLFVYFQDAFWIASAITTAAAMHCILTSMFIQVLGPGLALNGPIGSMAKAADGMRSLINHIFASFIFMTVSFAVSVLASFWAVMTRKASIATTAIFLASSLFWWRDCNRIYNKFKYTKVDSSFLVRSDDESIGVDALDREYDEEVRHAQHPAASHSQTVSSAASSTAGTVVGSGASTFGGVKSSPSVAGSSSRSVRPPSERAAPSVSGSTNAPTVSAIGRTGTSIGGVMPDVHQPVMRGYLTKREFAFHMLSGTRNSSKYSWVRYYYILTPNGRMFSFKDAKQYADHPDKPKSERPIELSWFEVQGVSFCDDHGADVFEIRLEFADKDDTGQPVVFRCDTVHELNDWMRAISSFTLVVGGVEGDDAGEQSSDDEP